MGEPVRGCVSPDSLPLQLHGARKDEQSLQSICEKKKTTATMSTTTTTTNNHDDSDPANMSSGKVIINP